MTNIVYITGKEVYDMQGEVITFTQIHANITIKNAIIDANPYIQIFDLTTTLINCKCRELSTAWFGAKLSTIDNSAQLQKAIDTCISNNIANLFIAGSYTFSQSLKACSIYKGNYVGFNLNIYGEGDMWSDRTTLKYTGDQFPLGVQMAKGGSLSRLKIVGNYTTPPVMKPDYYSTPFRVKPGHSGLVIDYDWTSNQGGSTAFKVHDMHIDGFDVMYNVSPNGFTTNADALTFQDIRIGNGRVGFQSGQAQEKGNQINNIVSWGNVHTLISIGRAGKQQAGQYIIRNGNIAGGCVQLFDINCSGWNAFAVDGLTAESIGRLGTITARDQSYTPPVSLDKLSIRFAQKADAGDQILLSTNSSKIKISNSNLWYYGAKDEIMNIMGPARFENCDFGLSKPTTLNIT